MTTRDFEGWPSLLGRLASGSDLSAEQARAGLGSILSGAATDAQIAAFIVGLRIKGETAEEIVGLSEAMLDVAAPLKLLPGTVDIVGTGGSVTLRDRAFNVSTISSIVAASAGATVCKHGNRKASSTSGSVDALEQLGVAVELDGPGVERCVAEAGVGFAFARVFHPAMRFVAGVRSELGIPTVFNLLGPLSHPGRVRRQVIGVADPAQAPLVAEVFARRGAPRAMVVHGSDGLDELTLSGPSTIHEVRDGRIQVHEVHPSDVGLTPVKVEDLGVGAPEQNAAVVREILGGGGGPRREVVELNAAAGLVVGGLVEDLRDGIELARQSIESGAALACLDRLVEVSNAGSVA